MACISVVTAVQRTAVRKFWLRGWGQPRPYQRRIPVVMFMPGNFERKHDLSSWRDNDWMQAAVRTSNIYSSNLQLISLYIELHTCIANWSSQQQTTSVNGLWSPKTSNAGNNFPIRRRSRFEWLNQDFTASLCETNLRKTLSVKRRLLAQDFVRTLVCSRERLNLSSLPRFTTVLNDASSMTWQLLTYPFNAKGFNQI